VISVISFQTRVMLMESFVSQHHQRQSIGGFLKGPHEVLVRFNTCLFIDRGIYT
jgi:hypothetical protein